MTSKNLDSYFIHHSFNLFVCVCVCRMTFFKCFKEKTVTILENDSEDFEKGTTLLVHKSLTNLQSLSVLVTMTHYTFLLGPELYLASLQILAIQNLIR